MLEIFLLIVKLSPVLIYYYSTGDNCIIKRNILNIGIFAINTNFMSAGRTCTLYLQYDYL